MGWFSFGGVKLEEAPKDAVPECPYCDKPLETIWVKSKGTGVVEKQQIIMCPECRKFLGFGTLAY